MICISRPLRLFIAIELSSDMEDVFDDEIAEYLAARRSVSRGAKNLRSDARVNLIQAAAEQITEFEMLQLIAADDSPDANINLGAAYRGAEAFIKATED